VAIEVTWVLVIALIIIGFFSGFYMVPLYTLLQHRAPNRSRGELVATSNFINVTGAIAASILFLLLVQASRLANLTPEIKPQEREVGVIQEPVEINKHGWIKRVVIKLDNGDEVVYRSKGELPDPLREAVRDIGVDIDEEPASRVIEFDDQFLDVLSGKPQVGERVAVSSYKLRDHHEHFLVRRADREPRRIYDTEALPSYLFLGAALMTAGVLFMLWRKLPDFFVRAVFWARSVGKYQLKAVGMQNLPTEGPVILGTNCKNMIDCLQLVSVTDRTTKVVLIEDGQSLQDGYLLRSMAKRHNLIIVRPGDGEASWIAAKQEALQTLNEGHLLAISLEHAELADAIAKLVNELRHETGAPLLPVFCGSLDEGVSDVTPRIRVVFGEVVTPGGGPAPTPLTAACMVADCRRAVAALGEWIGTHDEVAGVDAH
ncbi:MAG TPA: hypothetical protein VFE62_24715, partial [Gemmataceae bacterium]|nr:hypothetical protein [Gemmataceae bacterium]